MFRDQFYKKNIHKCIMIHFNSSNLLHKFTISADSSHEFVTLPRGIPSINILPRKSILQKPKSNSNVIYSFVQKETNLYSRVCCYETMHYYEDCLCRIHMLCSVFWLSCCQYSWKQKANHYEPFVIILLRSPKEKAKVL